ncbi:hypothetical protein EU527_05360 [Candidatus Thorarchaeota archaeon]|nr:MAG: hypothetical protein EU527_05360 [Candidatus Thorarchaeota archaeon]
MQTAPSLNLAFLGIPGFILGLFIGYILGDIDTLNSVYRILLGSFIATVGGIILSLLFSVYLTMLDSLEMLFIVLSVLGGFGLGIILNWSPYAQSSQKSHIIYEPDDDDEEFDRQIEEALGNKG